MGLLESNDIQPLGFTEYRVTIIMCRCAVKKPRAYLAGAKGTTSPKAQLMATDFYYVTLVLS